MSGIVSSAHDLTMIALAGIFTVGVVAIVALYFGRRLWAKARKGSLEVKTGDDSR